jgi:hypothetical protein
MINLVPPGGKLASRQEAKEDLLSGGILIVMGLLMALIREGDGNGIGTA